MDERRLLEQWVEMSDNLDKARYNFSCNILIAGSALFGSLVALRPVSEENRTELLLFSAACISLALALLLLAVGLYGHIETRNRARTLFGKEVRDALSADRSPRMISVRPKRGYVFARQFGYLLIVISLLLLAVNVLIAAL